MVAHSSVFLFTNFPAFSLMLLSCTLNEKCTLNSGQKAEVSDFVYRFLHSDELTGITVAFKMDKNPGFVMNLLMKVDMGIFYWIMCTFRAALTLVDGILFLLLGYTVQHGSQEELIKSEEYEHSAQLVTLLGRGTYTVGRICLTRGSSQSNIGLLLRML